MDLLREIEREHGKKKTAPFRVGDTVDIHLRLQEGDKERIQVFTGVCISRKHGGLRETFTVRRIVQGEGVERTFPLHSPRIERIAVKKSGEVRRAKLYFLRGRTGKSTRLRERLGIPGEAAPAPVAAAPAPAPAAAAAAPAPAAAKA